MHGWLFATMKLYAFGRRNFEPLSLQWCSLNSYIQAAAGFEASSGPSPKNRHDRQD